MSLEPVGYPDQIRFTIEIMSLSYYSHSGHTACRRIGFITMDMDRGLISVWTLLVLTALALHTADCSSQNLTEDDEATSSSRDVHSPIPVFTPPPGWVLGSDHSNAAVVLEVFLDLACPDSARTWPMLHDLREAYLDEDLRIIVHTYELPYHRNAYTLSQVGTNTHTMRFI